MCFVCIGVCVMFVVVLFFEEDTFMLHHLKQTNIGHLLIVCLFMFLCLLICETKSNNMF